MSHKNLLRVFVYGTLKQNQPNHYWLSKPENGDAKFLGEGKTTIKFPLVIGTRYNIPFLLNEPGTGNRILGEIYDIDNKMLENLDILEDYPNYYDREIQSIEMNNNGDIVPCWVYLIRQYPKTILNKTHLVSYENTTESPYCESYVDSEPSDLYDDIDTVIDSQPRRTDLYRFFAYGTLKKNQPNHFMLLNPENGYAKCLGDGKTKQKFPLIIVSPFNIPKLLYEPGIGYQVVGEVYEIDVDMLQKIDILSNFPDTTDRIILKIEINDGRLLPCNVYTVRNYPRKLLEQTFFMSYTDSEKYPYCTCSRPKQIDFSIDGKNLSYIFIYGSVKKNQPNHFFLTKPGNGDAEFVGEGRTTIKFPLVIGTRYNIPFILNEPGTGNRILGEIYEIDSKMLENFDTLHDYPEFFDREIQTIEKENDGKLLSCWVYVIRNFPKTMLNKTYLVSYTNTKNAPYIIKSKRISTISPKNDLDY